MSQSKKPLINVHTHIFTSKNIPRLLAKKMVPWPFYYLAHLSIWVWIFKIYKKVERQLERLDKIRTNLISFLKSSLVIQYLDSVLSVLISFNLLVYLLRWVRPEEISTSSNIWDGIPAMLWGVFDWIVNSPVKYLLVLDYGFWIVVGMFIVLYVLYPSIFRLIYSFARTLFKPLKSIPNAQSLSFINRYLLILEFAKYKEQSGIFNRLVKLYPPNSKMVVLPMDLEYMQAGNCPQNYLNQIRDLDRIITNKNTNYKSLIPFLFVDPRRIRDTKKNKPRDGKNGKDIPWEEKPFFDWELKKGIRDGSTYNYVCLKDCVFRDCFEGKEGNGILKGNFKGIKLYPALGYFPFDEDLLPVWAYCVQHDIPITTHCIMGTIFYRGKMEKKFQEHPVFKDNKWQPFSMKKRSSYDLQENFTHPLNYLCLLEPVFLVELLKVYNNPELNALFGLENDTISQDLQKLKLNLAHYGGSEEWMRYLEMDREDLAAELEEMPDHGIDLVRKQKTKEGENPYSKPQWIWSKNRADWFAIISSMMLQYKNVYADISYILHTEKIKPMLRHFLRTNEKLRERILFGTDFFVVRNHKSERQLLIELEAVIGKDLFDVIARENPDDFLSLRETNY